MCKILALTNSKKLDLSKLNAIGDLLLSLEKDGFGYAIQGKTNVFGEKCIAKHFESRLKSKYEIKLPVVQKRYVSFGKLETPIGPAIFHGRTSTNDKGLINCHPMIKNGNYLIHNGVVTDHGTPYKKLTTNDSEDVLHRFLEGISQVEAHLTGYYAFANIDDMGMLHVVRDSTANLHMAWCQSLDSFIFATTVDLMKRAAKILRVKLGPIDAVENNIYMVFKGNEMLRYQSIKPRGWDYNEGRYASKSLGRELTTSTTDYKTSYRNSAWQGDELEGWERDENGYWKLKGRSKSIEAITGSNVIDATKTDTYKDSKTNWDPYGDLEESEVNLEDQLIAYEYEIDAMDASYTIVTEGGTTITPIEFHKLDYVSQELCSITRPDGTKVVCPEYRRAE